MSENHDEKLNKDDSSVNKKRRDFLAFAAMSGGLIASYGTLAAMAGRFLYPAGEMPKQWLFVREVKSFQIGDSIVFHIPGGEKVAITRQRQENNEKDFVALSNKCPHLGCQVHWEAKNNRFFCPCHNGVFDPTGKGIGGPPADAGQSLPEYPLKIEKGMLFIEVPVPSLASVSKEEKYKC